MRHETCVLSCLSERKFACAKDCGVDALILDIEDSVAPSEKAAACAHVAPPIDDKPKRPWFFIVRVNALDTGLALDDLAAAVKLNGAADHECIGHYLDALEAKASMASGAKR
jgi:citrate lyase subunit beta / citryl-CoA lyase